MPAELIGDAFAAMAPGEDGLIRVVAHAPADMGKVLDVTLESAPLRAAMLDYGWRILRLSLFISLTTAAMVFFASRSRAARPTSSAT
jgi:hypothetical protein